MEHPPLQPQEANAPLSHLRLVEALVPIHLQFATAHDNASLTIPNVPHSSMMQSIWGLADSLGLRVAAQLNGFVWPPAKYRFANMCDKGARKTACSLLAIRGTPIPPPDAIHKRNTFHQT